MDNFKFWQTWLFVVSLAIIAFGFVLAFFNQTAVFDLLFNNRIDPAFWPATTPVTADVKLFQQWAYGVLGAMCIGWGIFMAFVAYRLFRAKEKWAWNCFALGITAWFVVDTAISLYFGVTFNAAFNIVLFVAVGLPLVFTRKDFVEPSRS